MLTTSRTITGTGYLYGDDAGDTIVLTGDGGAYGGAGTDIFLGGTGRQAFYGEAGNDILVAGAGQQSLYGGAGDDILIAGTSGSQYFDGGDGYDTFVTGALSTQNTVSIQQSYTTFHNASVTASVYNIEAIQFLDGTLQIGNTSPAAQVSRLYHTILGRAPDAAGLAGWSAAIRAGTPLATIATGFLNSAENQTGNAGQSNTSYVTQVYRNALGRAPDGPGLAAWVAGLQSGALQRADIAVSISESSESQAHWGQASTQTTSWVADEQAASVARLYDTAFGRKPDLAGVSGWIKALEGTPVTDPTTNLHDIATQFMTSAEFIARYSAPSDTNFVQLLYQNTLHRAADAPGLASWTGALSSGALDRATVMLGFSDSAEHQSMLAGRIEAGGILTSG